MLGPLLDFQPRCTIYITTTTTTTTTPTMTTPRATSTTTTETATTLTTTATATAIATALHLHYTTHVTTLHQGNNSLSLQKAQLQTPFGPSLYSLCHLCIKATHLSYTFLFSRLLPPPCAVLLLICVYNIHVHVHI